MPGGRFQEDSNYRKQLAESKKEAEKKSALSPLQRWRLRRVKRKLQKRGVVMQPVR